MVKDIHYCFCFTGAHSDEIDHESFKTIYETLLPPIKDVGLVCTGVLEMLETSTPERIVPKTYYELFSIIGTTEDYTVFQYPDSVWLSLKADRDILYYGYCR
jgi:hypothetical protein